MDRYPTSSLPHQRSPVLTAGEPLTSARAAVVLLPGRGAPANSLLPLVERLTRPGVSFLLPEAEGYTWYPYPFLAPTSQNQPYLSGALAKVAGVLAEINQAGIPTEQILVGGFSQGACLALEFGCRNPQRFGGLAALSGGLIGSDEEVVPRVGSFQSTPVYIGCGIPDAHIPQARVERSAHVLENMQASVKYQLFPGLGHTVNATELDALRAMVAALLP